MVKAEASSFARNGLSSSSKANSSKGSILKKKFKPWRKGINKKSKGSLKQQLRGLERLLLQKQQQKELSDNHKSDDPTQHNIQECTTATRKTTTRKASLSSIQDIQGRIEELKQQIAIQQEQQRERVNAKKSHGTRFLERQKLTRMYKKLVTRTSSSSTKDDDDASSSSCNNRNKDKELMRLALDQVYVAHFPHNKANKYLPLFQHGKRVVDSGKMLLKRAKIREVILTSLASSSSSSSNDPKLGRVDWIPLEQYQRLPTTWTVEQERALFGQQQAEEEKENEDEDQLNNQSDSRFDSILSQNEGADPQTSYQKILKAAEQVEAELDMEQEEENETSSQDVIQNQDHDNGHVHGDDSDSSSSSNGGGGGSSRTSEDEDDDHHDDNNNANVDHSRNSTNRVSSSSSPAAAAAHSKKRVRQDSLSEEVILAPSTQEDEEKDEKGKSDEEEEQDGSANSDDSSSSSSSSSSDSSESSTSSSSDDDDDENKNANVEKGSNHKSWLAAPNDQDMAADDNTADDFFLEANDDDDDDDSTSHPHNTGHDAKHSKPFAKAPQIARVDEIRGDKSQGWATQRQRPGQYQKYNRQQTNKPKQHSHQRRDTKKQRY